MTAFLYPVTPPIKVFYDSDGDPLEGGYIYYGNANQNPEVEANRIQMYWDAGGTIPAPQPFRTIGGRIMRQGSPANVYATGDYSVTIKNSKGELVVTSPTSPDLALALAVTGAGTAAAIPIADAGGYYTTDNVEAALQQVAGDGWTTLARLAAAVQAMLVPTGAVFDFAGTAAPTGYVLGGLGTIGDGSSGASRANADTSALYTLLWNSYTNTELVIQDSAGTPTTRGASASNDFAAHKRLPTPDCRGRVRVGKDNLGPTTTTAGRITNAGSGIVGTTMGAAGGTETHVLTTGQLASHTHTQNAHTHTQNSHTHTDSGHTHAVVDTGHAHGISHADSTSVRNDIADISVAGPTAGSTNSATTGIALSNGSAAISTVTATNQNATAVNQSTGSDTAHQNTQPSIIFSVIIKL